VLGLLAITLAISYATLRGQGAATQLARNNGRAYDAREAAHSGLVAALRKMSENAWAGVNTPLSANITANSWYNVTFITGDAKLGSADPKYSEYPYRVTIDSIGFAADSTNATVQAQHHSRCVVQLVRKLLTTEPANWTSLTSNTVYQWSNKTANVQFPVRINGPAVILGKVNLTPDYTTVALARNRYLSDLNARKDTLGDYRPLPSPLSIAIGQQDATNLGLIQSQLGITTNNNTTSNNDPLSHPGQVSTYKLYPGGIDYAPPVIQNVYGNPIQNVTLGPDPLANPLGIFRSSGTLNVQGNVKVTGTIIAETGGSDIQVYGTSVVLQGNSLPLLSGSTQVYQLPLILGKDDFRMNPACDVQVNGFAMIWDEFELKYGSPSTKFALTGNLATSTLLCRGRDTQWNLTTAQWATQYANFLTNLSLGLADPARVAYFPDYLQKQLNMTVQPILTFTASSSGVKPHWHDWTQPVFQPDTADPGLRWDVVRWEDNLSP
jgi:hypothetical protein